MTASDGGYDRLYTWIQPSLGPMHATLCRTVAWAILCLLLAQRAIPAARARALPAEQAGSGRACLRRVRRWWNGSPVNQAHISPPLVQMARSVLPPGPRVIVALDTTRLGAWEVWLAGIVGGGVPYPSAGRSSRTHGRRSASGPRPWRSSSSSNAPSRLRCAGRW
jgi:hypothetical protein